MTIRLRRCSGRQRCGGETGSAGRDRRQRPPCSVPGEGARASPFDKEEKIIISQPRSWELLGALFITVKKKTLFPAPRQRLFIAHTRVWRKCSICWVQPSTHTAYKLRAFTCRVPEIKHTHTHKRERSFVLAPARCLSRAVPAPRPRPALAPVQEFHIISDRFQLPQQGTALLLSSCSHIWKVLRQGVSRQSRAAGMHSPSLPALPALPAHRPARRCAQASGHLPRRAAGLSFVCLRFLGRFGEAFVAAAGKRWLWVPPWVGLRRQ